MYYRSLTHCHYTDCNTSFYLLMYSCYEAVISPAAMIRARVSAKMHMHVHYLIVRFSCKLNQYVSTSISHTVLTHFH